MADDTSPKLDQYGNEVGVLPDMSQIDQRLKNYDALQSQYGTPGQEALTALEGGAEGVLGGIAPALEVGSGLTTGEDIRNRALANPTAHGLSKAATFLGSLAVPGLKATSLAGAVGKAGELAAHAAPFTSPIVRAGIRASAEMAALGVSDEVSKMVTSDPAQSVGTAAANIGLSGVLGLFGGVGVAGVSKLGDAGLEKIGELLGNYRNTQAGLQEVFTHSEAVPLEGLPKIEPLNPLDVNPFKDPLSAFVHEKGAAYLANATAEGIASAGSAALGSLAGHPLVGYLVGHRAIKNLISPLVSTFAEKAVDSAAAAKAIDYVSDVLNGEKILSEATSKFFKSGAEVIGKDLIPTQESKEKLERELNAFQNNLQNEMPEGVGHYLPNHQTMGSFAIAQASNYLNGLKPKEMTAGPLGPVFPADKVSQAKYERALAIAQQPLMALKYAKEGTLLQSDVKALNTLYPGLHDRIIQKLTHSLINHQSQVGKHIPYAQKVSTSMLMGIPLENSLRMPQMQSIIRANATQQAPQTRGQKPQKTSASTLSQINKVNALYQTGLEANAVRHRK